MKKDMDKSQPMHGVSSRAKNHGIGYPIDIDSIEQSQPSHGVTDRGKSNAHAFSHAAHGNTGMDPEQHDYEAGANNGKGSVMGKSRTRASKPPADLDRRG